MKKPPPLVPSCLIAICEAAGPIGSSCSVTACPSASAVAIEQRDRLVGREVLHHALGDQHSASTSESGSSTWSVLRTRSTQKLPIASAARARMPRISATSTAMPLAADTKFCTARPSICVAIESERSRTEPRISPAISAAAAAPPSTHGAVTPRYMSSLGGSARAVIAVATAE